ncbi:MAG: hypothetical protein SPL62_06185 [Selenomonas sp.]|nr:hypothetical protein [Selenomonas sp.]
MPATVDPNDPKHVRDGHASEKNKVKLDEASIGRAFGPVYLKAASSRRRSAKASGLARAA